MPAGRVALSCRPEHHGPTSHEVGMRKNLTRTLAPLLLPIPPSINYHNAAFISSYSQAR
jgi:hypothetical protein